MPNVYRLNLPSLPMNIVTQALLGNVELANAISPEISNRTEELINFQLPTKVNLCHYMFSSVPSWIPQLNRRYNPYFQTDIISVYGVLSSTNSTVSCFTPHTDRLRRHAINYVVDLGGDNVKTCFYRLKDGSQTVNENFPARGKDYRYKDLESIGEYVLEPNQWYLFDPQIIHSVENLLGRRSFVGLTLQNNLSVDEILTLYPDIIQPFE